MIADHAERIAASAAVAAWAGAAASTLASLVALGLALWSAHREERRRRQEARDRETAFAFGMVGALEMIKPLIAAAQAAPKGFAERRAFLGSVDHARMIADAALAVPVFEMQMLRDAYLLRGVLNGLLNLTEAAPDGPILNRAILSVVEPVLAHLLDGDDRFFSRLPAIETVQGIHERTSVQRPAA